MSDSVITQAKEKIDELLGMSRYKLDVHGCPHFLDVFNFKAEEKLSEPWHYTVKVTCTAGDIASDSMLLKPASFMFQVPLYNGLPATPVRTVYGVVETFQRLSTSADETYYTLKIVPRIALLQHTKRSEIYLNQSVVEVVEQILRSHGLEGADFEFRLSQAYPARELITQWRETDLEFVQRLLAEVGIFWRFEMDGRLEQDVVIFQDSQEQYQFGITLPLIQPSRTSDNGQLSVWDIKTGHLVVSESVASRDYNYREALTPQDSSASVSTADGITTGEVYHYAEPFLREGDTDTPESGAYYARLRHERILNAQQAVTGKTTSPVLAPGEVLEPQGSLPASLKDGIVITGVQSSGSRKKSFQMIFTGLPYSEAVCYRPPLHNRPVIAGTLPARVESTEKGDTYAWLDNQGRYRTKLDFDRSSSEQGYAYLWLRMAKPYAGDNYGFHAPLLDGTEVSVMFDAGDPDRPYIAHAQHDSEHPDHVTDDNHTRNVLRTPANNKLRLEDKRQEEHIKLATEFGKTQLNIGHLVDARREQRGTGFELRTDEFGAVRAARGIYLTADAQTKGQGQVLEMNPAVSQITQANSEMQALNGAAEQAKALTCDIQTQTSLIQSRLKDLQSAVVLASAPQGVALTSGEHLQLTSAKNTMVTAGQHVDIGAMKNVTVSAEQSLGLFAHKAGAKVIANLGNVEVRAQHSTLEMSADQQFTVTSSQDEITISTPKTLTLNGGGSYLKLSESGIEHGTNGDFITKAASYEVPGSGNNLPVEAPDFNVTDISQMKNVTSKSLSD
ncbi:type VI secretion system tip protein VgrG [Enterobacter sp. A11]|uniref:type VI secretion system Vgr family protein n=1 Tax=unclassified Enterobacter TaxID=2608935 RepID=UPI00106FDE98|nr:MULTISPECIES: type VI secretion system Vgr family protein [unclassified Enterobacter]MBM1021650.1 type VI secretion system tip protein VgrG [Enterobacter sp. E1]MEA3563155.1 type VI secretion system tip protein VgrG [Enterobacter sp. GM-22]MEA3596563.1 type VI secretion system tip protein VgrG [Enterobacter sp. GM-31]TFF58036.1 type VI secretion system tip protein VgrG [Enterobacter sp. A11]